MARNLLREFMVNEIRDKEVIDYFKACSWLVTAVSPELLTSDAPLIVNGGHDKDSISSLSMALSPSRLFVMAHPKWTIDNELLRLIAFSHNLTLVDGPGQFIYSQHPVEDGPVVRLRYAIDNYFSSATVPGETRSLVGR